jgi:[ribosomal protein S5]-alanine N-acetyltransferase
MITTSVETERLRIRPFEPEDWRAVIVYASDPAVMEYIPSGPLDEAGVQAFIARPFNEEGGSYAVIEKQTNSLIGHMDYHPWFAPQTYEVGWGINPQFQRQGYASEAAGALLKHGFEELKLHRIIATCQPENPASYRVMEKIGMRREGWFKQCISRGNNVWWDEYFYAILATEWFSQHNPDITQ